MMCRLLAELVFRVLLCSIVDSFVQSLITFLPNGNNNPDPHYTKLFQNSISSASNIDDEALKYLGLYQFSVGQKRNIPNSIWNSSRCVGWWLNIYLWHFAICTFTLVQFFRSVHSIFLLSQWWKIFSGAHLLSSQGGVVYTFFVYD